MGPATSMMEGLPAETAPINWAGTVLSQPPISTTASIGCARTISSVSIDIRLRNLRLGRAQEDLAQGDGRKFNWQRTCGQHAALHRIQQFREMPMAVVEA